MKTRLLWVLILVVGGAALFFGLLRPDVPTDPKWIRDYREQDPATRPPVELPPMVVTGSRLTETSPESKGPAPDAKGKSAVKE